MRQSQNGMPSPRWPRTMRRFGLPFERAAQNQAHRVRRGFRLEAPDRLLQPVRVERVQHPRARHPLVQVQGAARLFQGSQDRLALRLVEVPAAGMRPDQHPTEPECPGGTADFLSRRIRSWGATAASAANVPGLLATMSASVSFISRASEGRRRGVGPQLDPGRWVQAENRDVDARPVHLVRAGSAGLSAVG